jgi:transposase
VLVDVETSRPVDVLPHRDTATVAAWLCEHPGAEIICRDRSMMFTKAIQQASWHLRPQPDGSPRAPRTPLLERVRQRHQDVQALARAGWSLSAIGRRSNLDRKTVRRYRYRDNDLDTLLASARDRGAGVLTRTCATSTPLRRRTHRLPAAVPRDLRPRETLTHAETTALDQTRLACQDIAAACDFARAFTDLTRHRRGHLLMEWIKQAERDAPAPIRGFAGYLRQDLDAVTAGPTLPYSSGVVEGHVNRIKNIKRQMYGRASFSLIRARILIQS